MASYAHRRQVLLFLTAVILPCTVLVTLGLRMVGQERELQEKRLADERDRITTQLRRELSTYLEGLELQTAAALANEPALLATHEYADSAIVLVAPTEDGRLRLPWEMDARPAQSHAVLNEPGFAMAIADGERAEFGDTDLERALRHYEAALEAARHPVQRTQAALLVARISWKLGHHREASDLYRRVLDAPISATDENGIELWCYAATQLVEGREHSEGVAMRLKDAVDSPTWQSPMQLYMLKALVDSLEPVDGDAQFREALLRIDSAVDARLAVAQRALALQRDFPDLPLARNTAASGPRSWIVWQPAQWLIGMSGTPAVVIVTRVQAVFASLEALASPSPAGMATLLVGGDDDGELLGAGFPDLRVQFIPDPAGTNADGMTLRGWFYLATVLLVLSATLFGAYLLWRDVQRELRVAELRSRFVSSVSHELKTPLTAIRMFAETLRMREPVDPARRGEYLDTIVNESERLTRLLNNVLDFTRIERGTKTYRRAPHSLAEIVDTTAKAMRYPLEQQQAELRVDIDEDLPLAKVDRDAIEQAILNLLTNAVKYSDERPQIDLRLRRENGRAVIEVQDRGVGIVPEEHRRIFDQFYRSSTPRNKDVQGTGLGLTLVDHIAKAHGGFVHVASAPGEGSTFAIHLPFDGGPS